MDRRMLINARHSEECRIAIVDGNTLLELEIESFIGKKLKGNIYKAQIARIEPSLQAAFVDLGTQRNGFLQINDVHPAYFKNRATNQRATLHNCRIQDVLEPGQELVVQVVKEERELKGATLTTYLSLPGRYLVLMPGSDRGGVSRKISDGEQRKRLRNLYRELEVPTGIGMIIRTAGLDRSQSELSRDLSLQLKVWEGIISESQSAACPTLLYKESDLATRVIRDYFTPDIREILIDDEETYKRVRSFVDQVMPRYRSRVKLYAMPQPLFAYAKIEDQVLDTLKREVKLRSGGALVIDSLEALVAIDVNSGKATAGMNIEETAYRTNLEAADEVARQLRLRDLGGLIVIDFIDMIDSRHRAAVENRLREAVKSDKARVEIGRLSKFGMLEMSRQRLRASLDSQSHYKCPHCHGSGRIRNHEMVALEVLRKIESAVVVGGVSLVKTRMAPAPAMFLLNHKKGALTDLERMHGIRIFVLADGRLGPEEYEFEMETTRAPAQPALGSRTSAQSEADEESADAERPPLLANEDDEDLPQRGVGKDEPDEAEESEGESDSDEEEEVPAEALVKAER